MMSDSRTLLRVAARESGFGLAYNPTAEWFKADDFYMIGDIPDAPVTRKPKLL